MALIKCSECGRDISDKAAACPGCGAPVSPTSNKQSPVPAVVHYDRATDTFSGTMVLMVKLAMRAVQKIGWKLDTANEALGLVTFQTGMTLGSWSGVSCSLNIEEVSPNKFRVSGTGKQSVRGAQLVALNIFGEAQSKAYKAIEMMRSLAASTVPIPHDAPKAEFPNELNGYLYRVEQDQTVSAMDPLGQRIQFGN